VTTEVPEWAAETARSLRYPLIFATVSGAHLYGFASVDSDLDVRACHLLGADLPYVPDLIAAKREAEHGPLPAGVSALLDREVPRLRELLENARDCSSLPDEPAPGVVPALHDLVVSTRLATV